ncbi:hypothetical protein NG42_07060 [Winslowiella iniecta]|uniref:Uncharacterized protein n=2 Tax=Winslowiella iniecta TaxID=1560201 RepID=A0A0L7T5Z5_9GAMM|nr:hypothetical protein NG42_07060 [Winslowiella iniecta]KOC94244.1 hypothetical protein NG43_06135 [Winslowiella iniecta]
MLLAGMLLSFKSLAIQPGTEFHFNSSCDFKQLTINVRDEHEDNPGYIKFDIKLQSEASARLAQHTKEYINQNMTLYINGVKITTSPIRDELSTGNLRVVIDNPTAQKIFPSLLVTQCQQE